MKKRQDREHSEQVALFDWLALYETQCPAFEDIFAIPNGGSRPKGTAGRMKAEGQKSGVPDICVPIMMNRPDGTVHPAMYIELKAPANPTLGLKKGRVSAIQKNCHERMRLRGNVVVVCYGWLAAAAVIIHYLDIKQVAAP